MGVDLHRIGTTISRGKSNNGFGTIVSFPSVSGGGGCPAAGTYNSSSSGIYPTSEGGESVLINGSNYAIETCDYNILNDGTCGTYIDWANVTNVQYLPNGTLIVNLPVGGTQTPVQVPAGYGLNYNSEFWTNTNYLSDGVGGYSDSPVGVSYYANSTLIDSLVSEQTIVAGNYYPNGITVDLRWDGFGGAFTSNPQGSYYAAGTDTNISVLDVHNQQEVPSMSGNFFNTGQTTGYTWDGIGGTNYPVTKGSVYSYGTFITNYMGTDYYWDGTGSYYS